VTDFGVVSEVEVVDEEVSCGVGDKVFSRPGDSVSIEMRLEIDNLDSVDIITILVSIGNALYLFFLTVERSVERKVNACRESGAHGRPILSGHFKLGLWIHLWLMHLERCKTTSCSVSAIFVVQLASLGSTNH